MAGRRIVGDDPVDGATGMWSSIISAWTDGATRAQRDREAGHHHHGDEGTVEDREAPAGGGSRGGRGSVQIGGQGALGQGGSSARPAVTAMSGATSRKRAPSAIITVSPAMVSRSAARKRLSPIQSAGTTKSTVKTMNTCPMKVPGSGGCHSDTKSRWAAIVETRIG